MRKVIRFLERIRLLSKFMRIGSIHEPMGTWRRIHFGYWNAVVFNLQKMWYLSNPVLPDEMDLSEPDDSLWEYLIERSIPEYEKVLRGGGTPAEKAELFGVIKSMENTYRRIQRKWSLDWLPSYIAVWIAHVSPRWTLPRYDRCVWERAERNLS